MNRTADGAWIDEHTYQHYISAICDQHMNVKCDPGIGLGKSNPKALTTIILLINSKNSSMLCPNEQLMQSTLRKIFSSVHNNQTILHYYDMQEKNLMAP